MKSVTDDKPLVSIIMNCFNGKQYLEEALKSVLDQTYENWELIFWDNKSEDESSDIFKKFKDNRFKYFLSDRHTTLCKARNLAIEKTKGDFLAFIDTDDMWLPNKLEKQIPLFKDNSVGLVYGNYWLFNKKNIIKKKIFSKQKLEKGKITEWLLKNYRVGILTILIRKKFIENSNEVFNLKYDLSSDFDFVIKFSTDYKFDCVQEPVAIYRQHEKQLSKNSLNQLIEEFRDWFLEVRTNPKINFFNLKFVENRIRYMEIVKLIYEKQWSKSFLMIKNYPFSLNKIKLIIILIFPKKLLKFFREYN